MITVRILHIGKFYVLKDLYRFEGTDSFLNSEFDVFALLVPTIACYDLSYLRVILFRPF